MAPQTIQAGQCTGGPPKSTCADAESTASTTAYPLIYDIVTIAQMIVAELAGSKRKATSDCTGETEVQPYALCPYYSHRDLQLHLMY